MRVIGALLIVLAIRIAYVQIFADGLWPLALLAAFPGVLGMGLWMRKPYAIKLTRQLIIIAMIFSPLIFFNPLRTTDPEIARVIGTFSQALVAQLIFLFVFSLFVFFLGQSDQQPRTDKT